VQSNLGMAFWELGSQEPGAGGLALLEKAVEAYRHAQEVYTRERQPRIWATLQGNAGEALRELGLRTEGTAGDELLTQAEAAWRIALEIFTSEQHPEDQEWARVELERTCQLKARRGAAVQSMP
jgi:hypothetical protein